MSPCVWSWMSIHWFELTLQTAAAIYLHWLVQPALEPEKLYHWVFLNTENRISILFPTFYIHFLKILTCIISPTQRVPSGRVPTLSLEGYGFKSTVLTKKIEFQCLPVSHAASGVELGRGGYITTWLLNVAVAHHSPKWNIIWRQHI